MLEQVGVEVLTTQVGITSRSLDGEDTTLDVQKRNIKGSSSEIVDHDITLLVRLAGAETVCDRGSGGLVDDTEDVETGDGTGILGGLSLVVVEVGGYGDHSLLHLLAQLRLRDLLHLRIVSSFAQTESRSCV